jgi:CspA family cold shock protein
MTLGTVRSFDARKGYGFIEPDHGGGKVQVTICAVERAAMTGLTQGQRLSFDEVYDPRTDSPCAENLRASDLPPSPREMDMPRKVSLGAVRSTHRVV